MLNTAGFPAIANTLPTGNTPTDSLLWFQKWAQPAGQPLNLSFSFPYASGPAMWPTTYGHGEPTAASGLNGIQQAAVRGALQAWANVANISFQEVAETASQAGDLRFTFTNAIPTSAAGWAYLPSPSSEGGDVWLNASRKAQPDWGPGTWNYFVLLHEIGHALGLKHPHEGGVMMPTALDSIRYTVMSYVMPPDLMRIDSRGGWSAVTSPMLYDIAAIQHLYGANMSYRAGNDVYAFGGAGSFCTAVWDAGGIDTFDFTGLRSPLDVSLVAGSTFAIPTTSGRSSTLSIAFNVTIENLIGGAGGDVLSGNDSGNDITGAGGDDILTGGGGDDTLRGGDGADTARFWLVRSAYTLVDNADGSWSVTAASGGEGRDVLWGVEWLEFADGRVRLDPQPVAPAAPGAIMGTAGADRLSGGAGSDVAEGLSGNDTMDGGAGDDILVGGAGADRLTGGAGYDIARYDVAVSVNLAKTSRSTGDARGDTYSSIEAFAFGDGADAFIGGKVGDTAIGGGGDDALSGGGGGDTLSGGDGNDILTGGAGRDLLTGGAGADRFVFASTGDLGDTIADYDAGDVLQFSSKAFGRPGALVTGETLIVSDDPISAVSRKATFLFDTDTGVLSYDRDGTGKAGPVTVATLTGVTTLDVSDFVFV